MPTKWSAGIGASITAPFFIAVSILFARIAGEHTPALFVAGLGSLISAPILLLGTYLNRGNVSLNPFGSKTRNAFLEVLVTRSIIGQALIIFGFTMTSATKSILLLRLEPIFVFLWSVLLLGERVTLQKSALLSLLFFGSLLVVWPGDKLSAFNLGDGLIVLSLLFLSYSYIPTRKVVEHISTIGLNLFTSLIGGFTITIAAIAFYGTRSIPYSWDAWAPIAAYSLSFFAIGISLYFYAFRTVKPWIIASFLSLEVVYGLLITIVMLSEKLTSLQVYGAATLLTATLLIAVSRKREDSTREAAYIGN